MVETLRKALAWRRQLDAGEVATQADIARLGHISRARVTQIMNLLNLAPDIQEEILFLPCTFKGRDPIRERHLRPIAAVLDSRKQRVVWKAIGARQPLLVEPASNSP